jgi:hypothetical protein
VVGVVVVGAAVVGGCGSTALTSRVAGVRSTGGAALIVAAGAGGIDAGAGLCARPTLGREVGVSTGTAGTVAGSPPPPRNGPSAVCARRWAPFPSATAISASATTSAQTETTNVTARRSRRSNSPWSTAALRLPAREANLVPRPVSAAQPATLSRIGRFSGCARTGCRRTPSRRALRLLQDRGIREHPADAEQLRSRRPERELVALEPQEIPVDREVDVDAHAAVDM